MRRTWQGANNTPDAPLVPTIIPLLAIQDVESTEFPMISNLLVLVEAELPDGASKLVLAVRANAIRGGTSALFVRRMDGTERGVGLPSGPTPATVWHTGCCGRTQRCPLEGGGLKLRGREVVVTHTATLATTGGMQSVTRLRGCAW